MSLSHPAWDAWIEILLPHQKHCCILCRIPHGMRGLKSLYISPCGIIEQSHPAWDAWIEIHFFCYSRNARRCRIPHGMRGLKFFYVWQTINWCPVASRMGCVD